MILVKNGGIRLDYFAWTDLYCIDCDGTTRQKFHCEMPDNTLLYVCSVCGCENSIENSKENEG